MEENNLHPTMFRFTYTSSNEYDDMVKAFNKKITLSLINIINANLTKIGITMGYDEERKHVITVNNEHGQVNISQDNSTLNAIQNNYPVREITDLAKEIKSLITSNIPKATQEAILDNLDCMTSIIQNENPPKSVIKTCLKGLKESLSAITNFTDLALKINSLITIVAPFII